MLHGIRAISGENGSVAYEDNDVKVGASYRYYVIPVHPQLIVDGQAITGEPSHRASVTIG